MLSTAELMSCEGASGSLREIPTPLLSVMHTFQWADDRQRICGMPNERLINKVRHNGRGAQLS